MDVVSPDRIIRLQGGQNFREVGGYPVGDGRRLRRGLIWRSAKLDDLAAEDVEIIRSLGITTIVDLRRRSERERSPTHEALVTATRVIAWDSPVTLDEQPRLDVLSRVGADRATYFAAMLALYREIVEQHTAHLRDLYQAIADGGAPVLIHCAAGKDRTGVTIGILLDLLGVGREHILSDYRKTEQLLDWTRLRQATAGVGASLDRLDRLDPIALELILRSDERYLAAAFDHVEARYGSCANFAVERLALSPETLQRLRDRLLEQP